VEQAAEAAGHFAYVSWFDFTLKDVQGVGPVLIPTGSPGYYATFIGSQQSQVADSSSGVTHLCFSQRIETLSWTSTPSYCSYPTDSLP